MLDILICIIPKIEPDAPTVGPAVLKSHLMANNFTCEVVDFNISLYNELKKDNKHKYYYYEHDSIFETRLGKDINPNFIPFSIEYDYLFQQWIEYIKVKNPKFLGLSVLSSFSISVAMKLAELVKNNCPHIKIIWGGAGMSYNYLECYNQVKEKGLMHHFIFGDGEESIVELLKGNLTYKGIDSVEINQLDDLNKMMIPNYDDIDWSQYELDTDGNDNAVYITGSRGCVKRCNFCNVYEIWPEYRFRSSDNILNEMLILRKKYNRKYFKFTDSLINGSMKTFRDLMRRLADYRKTDPDLTWISQWIIRPKHQFQDDDYRLMKESGCTALDVGIESFNEDIRFDMGKKFTDEDMWYCLDMLRKYEIFHTILMIVGYPTETEYHHQHTLDCIKKLFDNGHATKKMQNGGSLIFFSFSNTMMISEESNLWKQYKHEIVELKSSTEWTYKENTLEVRIRRMKEILSYIKQLSIEYSDNDLHNSAGGWIAQKNLNDYEQTLDEN